jgi:hypothetical protein
MRERIRGTDAASAAGGEWPNPQTLRVTPAMAAGVSKKLWSMVDVVKMVDAYEAAERLNWPVTEALHLRLSLLLGGVGKG